MLRLYIEAIKLGNISLLKSMSKKMMLLAKAHAVKATKSADIFLFSYHTTLEISLLCYSFSEIKIE